MGDWETDLEELRRRLAARAAVATRQLVGRTGVPGPEDMAQEVLTRLFHTYGETELRTWTTSRRHGVAARALHNLVVDLVRRKPLEISDQPENEGNGALFTVAADIPSPETVAADREMLGIFSGCFESVLDEQERRFVALSFELDSAPEAQKRLGWPTGLKDKTKVCHLRRRLLRRVMRCVERKITPPGEL